MPTLVFDDVRFYQGDFSLEVNLELPSDKLSVILGPSGSGKTTLLDICAGFIQPDSGHVLQGKQDVTLLPPEKRGIGMVFQDHALFPHMTVEDNVAFPLRMLKLKKKDAKTLAFRKLELVGIEALAKRFPSSLSGGERQRVSVARALAADPPILLLDEPFSSLDPSIRIRLRRELRRIIDTVGITALLVTHDQDEALAMADYLAIMHNGRIVCADSPADVWSKPKIPFAASFLGRKTWLNILDIAVNRDGTRTAITSTGNIPIPDEYDRFTLPAVILIRPEYLISDNNGPLCARLVHVEFAGSGWWMELIPEQSVENDILSVFWSGSQSPPIGEIMHFNVDRAGIRLIELKEK